MKHFKTLLILTLFCTSQNILFAQTADTLKVMTYNLRFGELATLEQFATYIKGETPDIVALQECDWKTNREMAPKQAGKAFVNELAYHTGLFGLYGKAIDFKGGYYGIGLLSKYPVIKSERIYLPNPEPKKEQRVMLVAELEMPDQSILTFICTHLEVASAEARKEQIQFINQIVSKIKTPVILAGDFNATPNEEAIKNGFANWTNATDTTFTYSTMKPEVKIDYIYGYPQKSVKVISTRTDYGSKLSDHFPVCSNVIIKGTK